MLEPPSLNAWWWTPLVMNLSPPLPPLSSLPPFLPLQDNTGHGRAGKKQAATLVKSTVEQTKSTVNWRSVAAELVAEALVAVRGRGGRGCEGGEIVIRGAEVAEVQDGAGEQGGMGWRAPTFAATTRRC